MPDLELVDAFLEPRHRELAAAVERFVERQVAPLPPQHDDAGARRQARQILALVGAERLAGHAIPEAFGGHPTAPDLRACCLIREVLAAASPLADATFAVQCLGALPIVLGGDEEQQRRVLPEVVAGRLMTSFAMTESGAGSDVASLTTRARRDGGEYVLDGHKAFISNAGIADLYSVFAATDPAAGSRGISCFLVPAETPGLTFAGPQVLSEPHPLGELAFAGCRVPAAARIGGEGEGFKIGMRTLDRWRTTVAATACGFAARALAEALRHAQGRRQFGQPLADFQLIQQKLARMATELAAARLLTYRAARVADGGAPRVTLPAAMAKLHATETAQSVIDDAVQIFGGRGVLRDSVVDRLYRAGRVLRIYEGTSEIQHLVIARQVLKNAAE